MRILALVLCVFFCNICFAKDKCRFANKKLTKIEKYVLDGQNEKALKLLLDIDTICNDPFFFTSLGDLHYALKKIKKAHSCYLKSYNLNGLISFNSLSVINFLKSSYSIGEYDIFNMVINNNKFKLDVNNNIELKKLIEKNNFAFNHKRDSVYFNPVSLSINSSSDEYFPSMPINSDIIIYTYRDSSADFQDEDFYISRKIDDNWTDPVRLGDNINSEYREGALSVGLDGTDVFFASCHRPDSYGGCDLYYSTLINDTLWSDAYNMGSVINTEYWESQPSISSDGNLLFFTSNRHGGYGGADIWMSKKHNNKWLAPVNMGPSINTSSDEGTPFLHFDNKTFYFSSKGHKGFGGFDLYVADIDYSGAIKNVKNIGYPINTHHDESGLIVSKDGLNSYYTSNANNNLDIYSFQLPLSVKSSPVAIINGMVIDSISRLGLAANILINKFDDSEDYNMLSDPSGVFSYSIPLESEFSISVLCDGYDFFSSNYELKHEESQKNITIVLNRLNVGNKINLDNIYYEFDDFSLKKESLIEIKKFANYLIVNSNLKVEIGGHTDNIGTTVYNLELSNRRAQSVYNELINFGVSPKQLTYKGYGSSLPLVDGDSEEDRLKNRRTEVKVIGSYE